MRALWIDPGETVGWATATVETDDRRENFHQLERVEWGIERLKPFALQLLERAGDYDLIGYENYRVQGGKELAANLGSDVPTLQLIGMIRLAAWRAQAYHYRLTPRIEVQERQAKRLGRGAAKRYFSDEVQAAVAEALAGRHDEGHHGDALLHLAAWFYHLTHDQQEST